MKTYEALNKEVTNETNFVLKDSDVQQVQESDVKKENSNDNKNIDIASFMNNNKEKNVNVNDIIMNRPTRNVKKKTIPPKLEEEDKNNIFLESINNIMLINKWADCYFFVLCY